jgi:hypothetical protein
MLLLRLLIIVLLIYTGFGAYLYLVQRSFIYMPVRDQHPSHDNFILVQSGEEAIKVWAISPGRDKAVIYFGGNAEDVFYNIPELRETLPGHSSYLVNYRDYGGSSGTPTEQGLFADALAVYDRLQEQHAQISVIGRSLGSGVATYLASQRPVDRLILVTAPDSALAIGKSAYPFYPIGLLLKDKYDSTRYAPQIDSPTLLLIAERDNIIPMKHSLKLFESFPPGVAEKIVIPAAGHNDLSLFPEYWERMEKFLRKSSAEAGI